MGLYDSLLKSSIVKAVDSITDSAAEKIFGNNNQSNPTQQQTVQSIQVNRPDLSKHW